MASQTFRTVDAAPGNARLDGTPAQRLATMREVVAFIGMQLGRSPAGPSPTLAYRRHGINQGFEEAAVVDICRAEPDGERNAPGVGDQVTLAAGSAAIGRVGAGFLAPLIWALKSSVRSSPDALSRCKRVVDRSWICPRLSPLAPMRSTAPHHLISGRDRVPDQHPACNGNRLRGGRDQSFERHGRARGRNAVTRPPRTSPARPGYVPMLARSGQVLTTASAGTRPVSTYLQIATSSFRARATMAIRLTRPVAVPTRSRYQRASALSG